VYTEDRSWTLNWWADHYELFTEEQDIEIEKVPTCTYQLRLTVNKTQLFYDITESQSVEVTIDKENKQASAKKRYKLST
jgi:hypothetical protein